MQDFVIREAAAPDVDKIIDLAVQSISHSLSPFRDTPVAQVRSFRKRDLEQLKILFGQPHVGLFVAEKDGDMVGHVIVLANVIESVSGEEQGWIIDLSVKPKYWGKGIAAELAIKAESFAKSKGLKYLGLGVTSENKRAIRFYEKLGFQEERKRMIKRI